MSCCDHLGDDHILVATGDSPLQGGVRLCPEAGCQCFATWSPTDYPREKVIVPGAPLIASLRRQIQREHA